MSWKFNAGTTGWVTSTELNHPNRRSLATPLYRFSRRPPCGDELSP